MSAKVIFLFTSCPTENGTETNQRRCQDMLESKKLEVVMLDGALPQNVEERNKLFSVSKLRGKYPQVFVQSEDGSETTFVGDWDAVQELLECDSIDSETLKSHPEINTFSKAFSAVAKKE